MAALCENDTLYEYALDRYHSHFFLLLNYASHFSAVEMICVDMM